MGIVQEVFPEPTITWAPTVELRKQCAEWAAAMNPKDAGDLIRKASRIYNWITQAKDDD